MRTSVPLAALALAFGSTLAPARAEVPARVDVRADVVGFYTYSDAAWLAADGHVTIRAGARTIVADGARYDLRKNRILASGDVRVSGRGDVLSGEAYALDLTTGSATLLRVDPVPVTLTLHADDLRTAVVEPPKAGTFDALDLSDSRPYIRSRHAVVAPSANLRMSPAEFPMTAGPALTLPTFLYTLASNQNFSQSAMPGSMLISPTRCSGPPTR